MLPHSKKMYRRTTPQGSSRMPSPRTQARMETAIAVVHNVTISITQYRSEKNTGWDAHAVYLQSQRVWLSWMGFEEGL